MFDEQMMGLSCLLCTQNPQPACLRSLHLLSSARDRLVSKASGLSGHIRSCHCLLSSVT